MRLSDIPWCIPDRALTTVQCIIQFDSINHLASTQESFVPHTCTLPQIICFLSASLLLHLHALILTSFLTYTSIIDCLFDRQRNRSAPDVQESNLPFLTPYLVQMSVSSIETYAGTFWRLKYKASATMPIAEMCGMDSNHYHQPCPNSDMEESNFRLASCSRLHHRTKSCCDYFE